MTMLRIIFISSAACFILAYFLVYFLTMKMGLTCACELTIDFQRTTWREDRALHSFVVTGHFTVDFIQYECLQLILITEQLN
jgi:hypothetical protein